MNWYITAQVAGQHTLPGYIVRIDYANGDYFAGHFLKLASVLKMKKL